MIRIGVAGWDYPDWKGVVYPLDRPQLDRLRFISRFVDTIEINSSFYRPPAPRTAESWLRRTIQRPAFRFTAKTHRALTHGSDVAEADAAAAATLQGLEPLHRAGRLGALLVQFPQSFHHDAQARERLERICERLSGWPLVIEVRHRSWAADEARAWFEHRAVGIVAVDQPRLASTVRLAGNVTGPIGYLRLHGRNARDWFRKDAGRDARYDYLYNAKELAPIAETARALAACAEELYVVNNNHFRGQALVNALQLRHLIEGGTPEAPEDLVANYPELEPIVKVERSRLL